MDEVTLVTKASGFPDYLCVFSSLFPLLFPYIGWVLSIVGLTLIHFSRVRKLKEQADTAYREGLNEAFNLSRDDKGRFKPRPGMPYHSAD